MQVSNIMMDSLGAQVMFFVWKLSTSIMQVEILGTNKIWDNNDIFHGYMYSLPTKI